MNKDSNIWSKHKLKIAFIILFLIILCLTGMADIGKYLDRSGFYTFAETFYKYEIVFSKTFNKKDLANRQNILAEFYTKQGMYEKSIEVCDKILAQEDINQSVEFRTRKNKLEAYYYLNQYENAENEYKNLNKIISKYKNLGDGVYALFPDADYAERIILNIDMDRGKLDKVKEKIKNNNCAVKEKIKYYRLSKEYKKLLETISMDLQQLPYVNPFDNKYDSSVIISVYADNMTELAKLYKDNGELSKSNFSEDEILFAGNGNSNVSKAYCNGALAMYKEIYNKNHPKVICTQYFCESLDSNYALSKNAKSLLMFKKSNDVEKLDNYCRKSVGCPPRGPSLLQNQRF